MSDESKLNPELMKLEESLRRMSPAPPSINRDELMYKAGWEAALALSLVDQKNTANVQQSTTLPTTPKPSSDSSTSDPTYLKTKTVRFWKTATLVSTAAAVVLALFVIRDSTTSSRDSTAIRNANRVANDVAPSGTPHLTSRARQKDTAIPDRSNESVARSPHFFYGDPSNYLRNLFLDSRLLASQPIRHDWKTSSRIPSRPYQGSNAVAPAPSSRTVIPPPFQNHEANRSLLNQYLIEPKTAS